ncbi:hypothetical protein [Pleionea sediminis]|uniref:hypothetical protein n=1 Tax=Pleionea sediminis TaxID=2569479 RepID=UPI00118520A4|nr:hypothetical protein [Pleionea sediminis]
MDNKLAKTPYFEVELIVDACAENFGQAPCTATGEPCHKTRKTCRDPDNYSVVPKSYKLCSAIENFPRGQDLIPCITDVSLAPTSITGGRGLGSRAKVTVRAQDFKHHDRGVDPYFSERSYDTSRGTFFGKWLARNPYYQARKAIVRSGFLSEPYDPSFLLTQHFLIEHISNPSGRNEVTMTFKDVLKQVDPKRAKYPAISEGELAFKCEVADDWISVKQGQGSFYQVNEHITMGAEILRVLDIDGDDLMVDRAQWNTEALAHSVNTKVQQCKTYIDENLVDIIRDVLINGANISSDYIDDEAWEQEKQAWLPNYNLTALIPKPEGCDKLLNELMEIGLLDVWEDSEAQIIRLKASSPFRSTIDVIRDPDFVSGSLKVSDKPDLRLSRVWVRFGLRNPLKKLDDETNIARGYALGDREKEAPEQYGDKRAKVITSRWLQDDELHRDHAFSLTNRLLSRYKDNPKMFEFRLWMGRSFLPKTGDVIKLSVEALQDVTGAPILKTCQIVERSSDLNQGHMKYKALAYDSTINGGDGDNSIVIATNQFNYNLWLAVGSPPEPIELSVFIEENVSICSRSAELASFVIGNFAPGSLIRMQNRGAIKGAGGDGGHGGGRLLRMEIIHGERQPAVVEFEKDATPGEFGGHAILGAEGVALYIDNEDGLIAAGDPGEDGAFDLVTYQCVDGVCDVPEPLLGHGGRGGDGCLPGKGGDGVYQGNEGEDGLENELDVGGQIKSGAAIYHPQGRVIMEQDGIVLGRIEQLETDNS